MQQVRMLHLTCAVDTLKRGAGQSAVNHGAYIAGQSITDRTAGKVFDWSKRPEGDVVETFLVMPDAARDAYPTADKFLNAIERQAPRSDSWVGRHWKIALPHDLDDWPKTAIVREFAGFLAKKYGVGSFCARHSAGKGDARNDHGHVITSPCTVTPDGMGDRVVELDKSSTSSEALKSIRAELQNIVNRHARECGLAQRVHFEYRSFADLNLPLDPTRHLGITAAAKERVEPQSSRLGQVNAETAARNAATAAALGTTVESMKSAAIRREPLQSPATAPIVNRPAPLQAFGLEPRPLVMKPLAELVKRPEPAPAPRQRQAAPPPAWSKGKGKKKFRKSAKPFRPSAAHLEARRRVDMENSPDRFRQILGTPDGSFNWDRLQPEFRRPIAAWLVGKQPTNSPGAWNHLDMVIPDYIKKVSRQWYNAGLQNYEFDAHFADDVKANSTGVLEDSLVLLANIDRMDCPLSDSQKRELNTARKMNDPKLSPNWRPQSGLLNFNSRRSDEITKFQRSQPPCAYKILSGMQPEQNKTSFRKTTKNERQ